MDLLMRLLAIPVEMANQKTNTAIRAGTVGRAAPSAVLCGQARSVGPCPGWGESGRVGLQGRR